MYLREPVAPAYVNTYSGRCRCPSLLECPQPGSPECSRTKDGKNKCRCGCPALYLNNKVYEATKTCCAGKQGKECGIDTTNSLKPPNWGAAKLPRTCSDACANAWIDLYEECDVELQKTEWGAAAEALYGNCLATAAVEEDCQDDVTWSPSAIGGKVACIDRYDSFAKPGQGCSFLLSHGVDCKYFTPGGPKYNGQVGLGDKFCASL